ncbi:hypothetical protein CALCODRAFT_330234 [Calocera cornea HHB12733]|uniref:Uncharacterized protein n=1 Tax=Calocera cornea HHB12733 TaxID=1353952 RepID=A0A165F3B7_9BASI|nr:hypothetical protein CALCODRAFT_330234 [Calocera cornea HHB12733]
MYVYSTSTTTSTATATSSTGKAGAACLPFGASPLRRRPGPAVRMRAGRGRHRATELMPCRKCRKGGKRGDWAVGGLMGQCLCQCQCPVRGVRGAGASPSSVHAVLCCDHRRPSRRSCCDLLGAGTSRCTYATRCSMRRAVRPSGPVRRVRPSSVFRVPCSVRAAGTGAGRLAKRPGLLEAGAGQWVRSMCIGKERKGKEGNQ